MSKFSSGLSETDVQICSPGFLKGNRTSSTRATLIWHEPYAACNLCPDAVGYEVSSASFNTLLVSQSPCELQLNSFFHRISVRAKGANGSLSEPSFIDIHPSPPAPTGLRATPTENGTSLSWVAPVGGERVFDYLVSHKGEFIAAVHDLSYLLKLSTWQRSFDIEVRARSSAGNLSDPATLDVTPPEKPTELVALNFSSRAAVLIWARATDNVGVVNYEVLKDGEVIATTQDETPTYSALGLQPETQYSFSVRALDAFGNRSEESAPVIVKTPVLDPPQNVRVTNVTRNSIVLAWDRPDGAVGLINYLSEVDNHKGSTRKIHSPVQGVAFTGLRSWSTYTVKVSAQDASERYSECVTLEVKTSRAGANRASVTRTTPPRY